METDSKFESRVIPYGEKTPCSSVTIEPRFESRVIPYGEKTLREIDRLKEMFESSVILYGENSTFAPKLYDFHIRVIGNLDYINAQFYRWILL